MNTEIKEYPFVIFRRELGSNIIFANYEESLKIDLTIAQAIVANRLEFTENEKHYLVLDVSHVRTVTPEAKKYMQQAEGGLKNILGAAFIANNPVSELIANVYVKTPKDFEARFFSNKDEAIRWIIEHKQQAIGKQ